MESRHELIEKLIHKYERYIAPFTFILGFVFDTLTLRRIDLWFDHIIILFYIFIAAAGITILNLYEAGRLRFTPSEIYKKFKIGLKKLLSLLIPSKFFHSASLTGFKISDSAIPFVPVVMQFAFGGLFSAFVIFYTTSAAVGNSWLFLLALALLSIGNERFRKHYQRLAFQLNIFFIALFSYFIFAVPLILRKIGPAFFLLSGLVSLVFLALFILWLYYLIPQQVKQAGKTLLLGIGSIYLLFNLLYFFNIIPPIPLSLKEGGVYHSIKRLETGEYELVYEPVRWQLPFQSTNSIYHWRPGEPVYFFSAVFAPTRLDINIFHQWSYYNKDKNGWDDYGRIKFPIVGGRDGGYRGYSYRTGVQPGKWRVEVKTEQGQILGRQTFTIVRGNDEVLFKTTVK